VKASLPKVRKGLLDKTHVSYGANAMFGDLMSMAKSLACFFGYSHNQCTSWKH